LLSNGGVGASTDAGCVVADKPSAMRLQRIDSFIAEFKITTEQVLADGTRIKHETTDRMARSRDGRFMNENTYSDTSRGSTEGSITNSSVNDRKGLVSLSWNSQSHKVLLQKYPPKDQQYGCWADSKGNVRITYPEYPSKSAATNVKAMHLSAESAKNAVSGAEVANATKDSITQNLTNLGVQTIDGIDVMGSRTTTTIPSGYSGNDRPLVSVDEIWFSPSLGNTMREFHSDPQTGTRTKELTSLIIGDPDPKIFEAPEGYEIETIELHKVDCQQK